MEPAITTADSERHERAPTADLVPKEEQKEEEDDDDDEDAAEDEEQEEEEEDEDEEDDEEGDGDEGDQEAQQQQQQQRQSLIAAEEESPTTDSSAPRKRSRTSSHSKVPSVQVIYNCLTRESRNKLKAQLQQWAEWHGKNIASIEDIDQKLLENGDETYIPLLQLEKPLKPACLDWTTSSPHKGKETITSLSTRELETGSSAKCLELSVEVSRCPSCGSLNHSSKECPRGREDSTANNARRSALEKRGSVCGSFRDIYYQGGKSDESKPGCSGSETRQSLVTGDKDPPPWLHKIRELGCPPGYLVSMGISLCGAAMSSSMSWDMDNNWSQEMTAGRPIQAPVLDQYRPTSAIRDVSTFFDPKPTMILSPRGYRTPIRMPLNCLTTATQTQLTPETLTTGSQLKRKRISQDTARLGNQGQHVSASNTNGFDSSKQASETKDDGTRLVEDDGSNAELTMQGPSNQEDGSGPGGQQSATFDNWDPLETTVLVAAKLRLEEMVETKKLPHVVKSKNQRWDYISEMCARSEVRRTGTQCMNRWNRVLKEWKAIYNYEQNIPPSQNSYWAMMIRERKSAKLPSTFDSDLFKAIESRYGRSRGMNRGGMMLDSSGEILGIEGVDHAHPPNEHAAFDGDAHARMARIFENASSDEADLIAKERDVHLKESANGYERRSTKAALINDELEESFKKLVEVFERVEEQRNQWQKELVEIRRKEYQATLQLNKERIDNEKQGNMALFQIANAIHTISHTTFANSNSIPRN